MFSASWIDLPYLIAQGRRQGDKGALRLWGDGEHTVLMPNFLHEQFTQARGWLPSPGALDPGNAPPLAWQNGVTAFGAAIARHLGLQLRQHLKKGHPFPENNLAPCTSKRNDEGHLFLP